MKGTPSNLLAFGSASAISPMENLYKRNWEATIQRYRSPENSFANTLMPQRAKPDEHCASIHLLEWSSKGSGRKPLLKRWNQVMRQSTRSKRREQRNALRMMTLIMRNHHRSTVFQSNQMRESGEGNKFRAGLVVQIARPVDPRSSVSLDIESVEQSSKLLQFRTRGL